MDNNEDLYSRLNFERALPLFSGPILAVGGALALLSLAWLVLPPAALYCLLVPTMGVLVWMAWLGRRESFVRLAAWFSRLSGE